VTQVRELVSAFGELRAFNLVKDVATGLSRGFCFFEYGDTTLTDRVCQVRPGSPAGRAAALVASSSLPRPSDTITQPRPTD